MLSISSMIECHYYTKYGIFDSGCRKKQLEGFEPTAIGRGSGLATRLLLQLQVTNHQTLIHLRNFKVFVSSMMTLNILIMSYLEVLKKSDSGN